MLKFIYILNAILPLFYGITFLLYAFYFSYKNKRVGNVASWSLLLTIGLHCVFMIAKGYHYQTFPIRNFFASISMLALDIAVIYWFVERFKQEKTTGMFFLLAAFLFQFLSSISFQGGNSETNELLQNPMFGFHTAFALLGFSALAISGIYGFMYWMLSLEIKRRHFGIIYDRLPPLETLEEMGIFSTFCAICLLGAGIFLGHLWAYQIFNKFFVLDPKILATDLTWLTYTLTWIVAQKKKLRGLRMSILSFWGAIFFLSLVATMSLFSSTFHRFF